MYWIFVYFIILLARSPPPYSQLYYMEGSYTTGKEGFGWYQPKLTQSPTRSSITLMLILRLSMSTNYYHAKLIFGKNFRVGWMILNLQVTHLWLCAVRTRSQANPRGELLWARLRELCKLEGWGTICASYITPTWPIASVGTRPLCSHESGGTNRSTPHVVTPGSLGKWAYRLWCWIQPGIQRGVRVWSTDHMWIWLTRSIASRWRLHLGYHSGQPTNNWHLF